MKLINVGYGNMVAVSHIIAIVSPDSAPIKRMVQDAKEHGTAIDATFGRRTKAVIITDSDHIILSAIQPKHIAGRIDDREDSESDNFEEGEEKEVDDDCGNENRFAPARIVQRRNEACGSVVEGC